MLNFDQIAVINFVDEFDSLIPVERRVKVYRGMADFIHDDATRAAFMKKVALLEAAEGLIRDLDFNKQHPVHDGHGGQS